MLQRMSFLCVFLRAETRFWISKFEAKLCHSHKPQATHLHVISYLPETSFHTDLRTWADFRKVANPLETVFGFTVSERKRKCEKKVNYLSQKGLCSFSALVRPLCHRAQCQAVVFVDLSPWRPLSSQSVFPVERFLLLSVVVNFKTLTTSQEILSLERQAMLSADKRSMMADNVTVTVRIMCSLLAGKLQTDFKWKIYHRGWWAHFIVETVQDKWSLKKLFEDDKVVCSDDEEEGEVALGNVDDVVEVLGHGQCPRPEKKDTSECVMTVTASTAPSSQRRRCRQTKKVSAFLWSWLSLELHLSCFFSEARQRNASQFSSWKKRKDIETVCW